CAAAAYGIAQYAGWDPLLRRGSYHIGEGIWAIVRPPGTLGYVSYYATWLLISTFLSVLLLELETSDAWKHAARASAATGAIAILLSGTRAGWLGLAAGSAFWFWLKGFRPGRRSVAVVLG